MRVSIDNTKWWQTAYAALIFFTRLPFWRFYEPPKQCYSHVVEYWPLAGWLTGSVMGATVWIASQHTSATVAVLLALALRMLLTGALHEDGLADFFDGFGGGRDRKRILEIMKDSHIGTYGVLGLLMYLAILVASMSRIDSSLLALSMVAADPFCKMISAQIIMFLPYARTEEEAKAKTVYVKYDVAAGIRLAVLGLLPMVVAGYVMIDSFSLSLVSLETMVTVPCLVFYGLYMLMNSKLRGYTGDCCGALFLLVELSFFVAFQFVVG
ncbi:MAG: adenosylcobinamide-GDP ribazoletransferase [Prevotellaceae bacterium]|nr:adenosylcobinamide-GDP ribazoletransferase [Prevotellaceae bacterium]